MRAADSLWSVDREERMLTMEPLWIARPFLGGISSAPGEEDARRQLEDPKMLMFVTRRRHGGGRGLLVSRASLFEVSFSTVRSETARRNSA